MTAAEILDELRARGGTAYRYGARVRIVPATAASPDLTARVHEHKAELLALLPEAPPEIAALPATSTPPMPGQSHPWIISSSCAGGMRLVVVSEPPWPDAVFEAAALVEVLDARHRADRRDAQEIADRLDAVLSALRADGIGAWLTS